MSIQLDPKNYIILNIGGKVVETSDFTCISDLQVDFKTGDVIFSIPVGTMVDGEFAQSASETPLRVRVNLENGTYEPLGSLLFASGTLSGPMLAQFRGLFRTVRNSLEQAVLATGAVSGNFIPW